MASQLSAAVAGGICATSTQVPDLTAKIDRCNIGALNPPPPAKPQAAPAGSDGMSAMAALLMPGSSTDGPPALPGLRMTGQFIGSGGLTIFFDAGNAVLDCGPAHVRSAYTVLNTPSALVINVENPGSPSP